MASEPLPAILQPMLPTLVKLPFSNPDWIFEPKWDGYRAICFLENGSLRFISKNHKSLTQRFPDLQKIPKSIKAETAILDGEIVALEKGSALLRGTAFRKYCERMRNRFLCLRFTLLER